MKISKAKARRPMRIMIYGQEGVGKSTFGAKSDKPIFISPEGGNVGLVTKTGETVTEFEEINTFKKVIDAINYLRTEKHEYETLVLDSADWIEQLAHDQIIGGEGGDIIRAKGGYGAGFRSSEKMHRELIQLLEDLSLKKNMNIIITAHSQVKKIKDPDIAEDYDAHSIKCHEFVSSLWRQWVDMLGFARFFTVVGNESKRVMGNGDRLLNVVHEPAFQAKNRYGITEQLDFEEDTYDVVKSYWQENGVQPVGADELIADIKTLLKEVTDKETKTKATKALKDAGKDVATLAKVKKRLEALTGKGE